jgi:hypothetical protein
MDWGIVVGAALAVAGGALTIVGGMVADLLKDRRVDSRELSGRAAEREVDRKAFQRQTLLDLQAALAILTSAYRDAYVFLLNTSAGQPDLGFAPYPPELSDRLETTADRVRILASRVLDDDLRDLVGKGLALSMAFPYSASKVDAHVAMAKGNEMLITAGLRCGEITRGLW